MERKKTRHTEAMGQLRGGLGTEIRALVDALGNPARFDLTSAQTSEHAGASTLLNRFTSTGIAREIAISALPEATSYFFASCRQ